MPEIRQPGAGHEHSDAARSRGEGSPETRGRPRRGSRGLEKGSGTFRATWLTRPWVQNRHGGTRGRRPRWERSHDGATNSGEQLHGHWVILGEIKTWEGCSPRVRTAGHWENGGGAVEPRVDGGELRLRKKHSGERGPGKPERGKANRRVSRVADVEAELTEATDGARAQRRSLNGRRSTVSGGGAIWSRAQSERVRLRAQVSGGKWASEARGSKGAGTCGGGRRSRGRGRVHGGGTWVGGWGRADRWGWRNRESGRACERNGADKPGPLGSGRERGRAGWRRQAGPAYQAPRARGCGRARVGWA
jgi:hypothetical protein